MPAVTLYPRGTRQDNPAGVGGSLLSLLTGPQPSSTVVGQLRTCGGPLEQRCCKDNEVPLPDNCQTPVRTRTASTILAAAVVGSSCSQILMTVHPHADRAASALESRS